MKRILIIVSCFVMSLGIIGNAFAEDIPEDIMKLLT